MTNQVPKHIKLAHRLFTMFMVWALTMSIVINIQNYIEIKDLEFEVEELELLLKEKNTFEKDD